ncbi:MAG: LysR family transcriptional regulator [Dinoroseobacter sp.]|nr:LysR family transcriptional regulator [Dinoroseobacter sp.]
MNINDVDLNLLRVFQAVAEERSVTRAADRLGLSQPAVSNALKRARKIFADQLLVRGSGGMHLTPRGEQLAHRLEDVMDGINAALAGGSEVDPSRIVEPIIITSADEEIILHGANILAGLERAGCDAPLQFLPLNTRYRADVLWRQRLAVTITTMLYAPEGLKQRKLYDEHLVCLMRKDHPTVDDFDLDAYLAADHLLVAPLGGPPTGYLDEWFRKQGRERRVRLISHTFGAAASLVEQSGMIATLPSRHAAKAAIAEHLIVRPVPADVPPFSVHMFWSERYDNDPVSIWLRSTLYEAILRPAAAEGT